MRLTNPCFCAKSLDWIRWRVILWIFLGMINALLSLELCQLRPSNLGGKAERGWSTSNSGDWQARTLPPPAPP